MTDRERLIELITEKQIWGIDQHQTKEFDIAMLDNEELAEHLLENGVIVPPCKVGDTVYYISFGKVYKGKCHAICLQPSLQIHLYDFDGDNATYPAKDVFTSREEAERALKEREQK